MAQAHLAGPLSPGIGTSAAASTAATRAGSAARRLASTNGSVVA